MIHSEIFTFEVNFHSEDDNPQTLSERKMKYLSVRRVFEKGYGVVAPLQRCGRISQATGRWLSFTDPSSHARHGDCHSLGNGIDLPVKLRSLACRSMPLPGE